MIYEIFRISTENVGLSLAQLCANKDPPPATVFATNFSNVFYKRDCSKLEASEGLIKFNTPQKASEAGCLPCNYCKP